MKNKTVVSLFLFLSCVCLAFTIHHPEEKSAVLEGEHFIIFFERTRQDLAKRVCNLAEEAYLEQKSVFGIDLESKIPVIIKSHDRFSFGEADPFTDTIIINEYFSIHSDSSSNPPYRDVLGHELAHIFTFKLLSKRIHFLKRMITLGFMPMWLIEGIAQFVGEEWNASNDAYMRSVSSDNCFLSLHDLNSFYYFNLENRHRGYMESYAFVRYLFQHAIKEQGISSFLAAYSKHPLDLDRVLVSLCGKKSSALYKEYTAYYREYYESKDRPCFQLSVSEEKVPFHARYQRFPRFSPDGSQLAFIGDEDKESHRSNNLYLYNLESGKYRLLAKRTDPFYDFSPSGKFLTYSHLYFASRNRVYLSDIFVLDLASGKKEKITDGLSARFPCFLDEKSIAFVKFGHSGDSLCIYDLKQKTLSVLIPGSMGYFFYSLRGYGDSLLASCFDGQNRQIVEIETNGKINPLTNFQADNRLPVRTEQGVLFLSSNSGKFSLCLARNPEIKDETISDIYFSGKKQYSNLGCFSRDILDFDASKKLLAYTTYGKDGYSIRLLRLDSLQASPASEPAASRSPRVELEYDFPVYPYSERMSLSTFTPWAEYDEEARAGILVAASDFLGKNQLLAKMYYNFESRRIGEKLNLVSRKFPFVAYLSYENDVYQSHYGTSDYLKRQESFDISLDYPMNPKELLFWGVESKKISSVELDPPVWPPPFQGKINLLKAGYKFFKMDPSPDWDINPRGGRYLRLEFRRADECLDSDVDYNEYRLLWDEYLALPSDPQTLFLRMGYGEKRKISNINTPILYGIGGWSTVRGFNADSRFGTKYAIGRLEYRFPVKTILLRPKMGYFYLNKLFASVFYDSANAWYNNTSHNDFLSSTGVEFSLKSLVLGKTAVITRAGLAGLVQNGSGIRTYIKFELPGF